MLPAAVVPCHGGFRRMRSILRLLHLLRLLLTRRPQQFRQQLFFLKCPPLPRVFDDQMILVCSKQTGSPNIRLEILILPALSILSRKTNPPSLSNWYRHGMVRSRSCFTLTKSISFRKRAKKKMECRSEPPFIRSLFSAKPWSRLPTSQSVCKT